MNLFFKRVFLDYAATTPVDKHVMRAMKPFFTSSFANPLSYYQEGLHASRALEDARHTVAAIAGVKDTEVIFTGSGTESDNLALRGVLAGIAKDDSHLFEMWKGKVPHIVTTAVEHPAILETAKELERSGRASVTFLPVQENGAINTSHLQNVLTENTLIVSVMLVNNEIGSINALRDVAREVKKFKNKIGRRHDEAPYIHTDASQAPCFLDVHIDRLGVDMMTLDGSKIYGPKGVGCFIKKSYVPCASILYGGNQEFGIRPATHNVPLIVGFARALELASERRENDSERITKLQSNFILLLEKIVPEATLNGGIKNRVPNNVNVCVPGLNSEFAVIQLDELGVACSAMTSCKSTSEQARSYVVDALGASCGASSLRFTLGRDTTASDIRYAVKKLRKVIDLQKLGK